MNRGYIQEFDSWPDPVLLVDSDGYVRHANGSACAEFGYSLTQFTGVPLQSLAPRNLAERRLWVTAMHTGDEPDANQVPGFEVTCVRKNGEPFRAFVTFASAPRHGEAWTWVMFDVENVGAPALENPAWQKVNDTQLVLKRSLSSPVPAGSGSLSELVQAISAFDSIFQNVSDELAKTVGYDTCNVVMVDQESGYNSVCHVNLGPKAPSPVRHMGSRYPINGTIVEDVLVNRSAMLLTASSGELIRSRYPGSVPEAAKIEYLSNIAIPVVSGEQIPCVIFIKSTEPDAYSSDDVEFVTELVRSL